VREEGSLRNTEARPPGLLAVTRDCRLTPAVDRIYGATTDTPVGFPLGKARDGVIRLPARASVNRS